MSESSRLLGQPEPHDPYAALRHRDYRLLLAGIVLASFGSEMMAVVVGWELYERTGSAADLGYVGLAQFLPVLFLSLPAGHAADRFSRKRILVAAQSLMALASVCLAMLSFWQGPVPLIYLLLLLAGISRAFAAPARWALLPQVVPASILGNAVTWNSSGWHLASVCGPALGGLVVALSRAANAYLLAAICSAACALLVSAIRAQPRQHHGEPASLASLAAGIRFVWQTKLILATITLDLFAVLLGGAVALLPMFAKDILRIGPAGLGWLRAADPLGALAMAFLLAHLPPMRHAGRALLVAVAGFGLATIGFGLSTNAVLSFILLVLVGALDNVSVVVRGTLVQSLTPDPMRGRVSAVNAVFIGSSNYLGAFESGMTAAWFGPVISVVGGGVGTILVVLLVMLRWPEVLRLGPLHPTRLAALGPSKLKEPEVAEPLESP
jgi:MFS family permease